MSIARVSLTLSSLFDNVRVFGTGLLFAPSYAFGGAFLEEKWVNSIHFGLARKRGGAAHQKDNP